MGAKMQAVFKYTEIALGAVLLLFGTATKFTVGSAAAILLGLLLFVYGIFHKRLCEKLPKWLKIAFAFGYIFIFVFVLAVFACGRSDTADHTEDAVIVLGSGIKGEQIGANLQGRLDKAIEYHRKNPEAVIVVSGGKGPHEDITEALAMERYLVSKGVSEDIIIKEENSTSTYENFIFSKKLLDAYFGSGEYRIAYVTSEYHIYRAGLIASEAGYEDFSHMCSATQWYTAVSNGLREMLAILKTWVFGN